MNSRFNTIRNVFVVGFGGVVGQSAVVLCMPVLTRLYSPESYGQWALLMTLVLVAGTLASLRYELSVLLPDSHDKAANVFALCLCLSVVVAASLALFLLLVPNSFVTSVGFAGLRQWFWAVPLLVVARGFHQTCISWYTRMAAFSRVSLVTAMLPMFTIVTQIALPLLGASDDARGLVVGSIVGHTLAAGVGILLLIPGRQLNLRALSWQCIKNVFLDYRKYPLYMTPYTIVSELRNRLAAFLFAAYGQTMTLGYFVFSEKMTRVPVNTVTNAIRPVFFQKAAAHPFRSLQDSILRSLFFINKAATPFFVLFWLAHARIFEFVFGPEWRGASVYGVVLSVPMFILLHTNWLDRSMDVLGRQKLAFLLETAFSVASVLALVAGLLLCGSVFYGVLLQAVAFALYNIVWLLILFRIANFRMSGLTQLAAQAVVLLVGWGAFYVVLAMMVPAWIAVCVYIAAVFVHGIRVLQNEWIDLQSHDTDPAATDQAFGDRAADSASANRGIRRDAKHRRPSESPLMPVRRRTLFNKARRLLPLWSRHRIIRSLTDTVSQHEQ